jgi:hypothetical protein
MAGAGIFHGGQRIRYQVPAMIKKTTGGMRKIIAGRLPRCVPTGMVP